MNTFIIILIVLLAFMFMEFTAWFTHKFVMHGFLWILHKDHHIRVGKRYEWNDLFAIIFAGPAILLIYFGYENLDFRFWIGLGIALYGIAYFTFHDILIHSRLKFLDKLENNYFRAIISAHEDHHSGKENYGFLFLIPWKYFKKENQKNFYHRRYAN